MLSALFKAAQSSAVTFQQQASQRCCHADGLNVDVAHCVISTRAELQACVLSSSKHPCNQADTYAWHVHRACRTILNILSTSLIILALRVSRQS